MRPPEWGSAGVPACDRRRPGSLGLGAFERVEAARSYYGDAELVAEVPRARRPAVFRAGVLVYRCPHTRRHAEAAYGWRYCTEFEEKEVPMADTVRGVDYYYATVPDAPGEVQRILSALKDNGVNLAAFHGFPVGGGRSQIDLVPDDPESLQKATEQTGMRLSEAKRAFLIQGDDRVGAVADTTAKLAEANVNITAATAIGAGSGRYGMILWVVPADYEKAAGALGA